VVDAEGGAEQQTKTTTLLLVALLLSAFQVTSVVSLERQTFPFSGPSGLFVWGFLINVLSFLINPILLFYVFYRLGKPVRLEDRYISVCASIFVGGMVGYAVPYFLVPVAFGSSWSSFFPDYMFFLATASSFAIGFVSAGLGVLFPSFVAIAVANYRTKKQLVPDVQAPPQTGNPSQTLDPNPSSWKWNEEAPPPDHLRPDYD